jgi:uncharacterized protein
MADPKIIEIIKEYLVELQQKGLNIKKAYLYGSQANGTATDESDIDLMLISPLFDEDTDKYMPAIWLSPKRTDNKIEPVAVGEKRFIEDNISPLIEIVRQEGIEIAA